MSVKGGLDVSNNPLWFFYLMCLRNTQAREIRFLHAASVKL